MSTDDKWLPIYEYAERSGEKEQNVYRWIRENKVPSDYIKRQKIVKEKLFIRADYQR